jgi:hypothetical protein
MIAQHHATSFRSLGGFRDLNDALISIYRKEEISIDISPLIGKVMIQGISLVENLPKLLILHFQFSSGLLWSSVPMQQLSALLDSLQKLCKSLDTKDLMYFGVLLSPLISMYKTFHKSKPIPPFWKELKSIFSFYQPLYIDFLKAVIHSISLSNKHLV